MCINKLSYSFICTSNVCTSVYIYIYIYYALLYFSCNIGVGSNFIRGNFVRLIKLNLFNNNTVLIGLYINTY